MFRDYNEIIQIHFREQYTCFLGKLYENIDIQNAQNLKTISASEFENHDNKKYLQSAGANFSTFPHVDPSPPHTPQRSILLPECN